MFVKFKLTGVAPLLQHNVRLANPLDLHTQALAKLSKKRNKTLADHEELSRTEWEGGLYFDDEIGPYVPAPWIDRALEQSGKIDKLGTLLKQSSQCVEDFVPIEYKGPRTINEMWDAEMFDRTCVGVQRAKTLRTRPRFDKWSLSFSIQYDDKWLEREQIIRCMTRAGERIGLGDYRPRFGRFNTEVVG